MRLRRIAARVASRWLGREDRAGVLLVCEVDDGFVILPPEIAQGEASVRIDDATVGCIEVDGAVLASLEDAVLAAQHAADAAQRTRILEQATEEVH